MASTSITSVLVGAAPQFRNGATLDLCALADFKAELDIDGSANDAWLRRQIRAESQTVSNFCNRVFQVQSYREKIWPFRDSPPRKLRAELAPLQLTRWPLANDQSQAGVAPPQAPTLSSVAGGALPAARYYVRISLVTAQGETAASLESNLAVAAGAQLVVASPVQDPDNLSIGWQCYVATSPNIETLQNVGGAIAIGTNFILPASSLVAGTPLPNFPLVIEDGPNPKPLVEGLDFQVKAEEGQIERLHRVSGDVRNWTERPILVEFKAGFATIPDDVQDAVIQLVKYRWFARRLDPAIKSDNVAGVYQADRWFGSGPGGPGDLPNYVAEKLQRYRVPVIA